ncbi:MAG: YciI family protein [Polyangiaceae bacterium]
MKYLILIHLDKAEMAALAPSQMMDLNVRHNRLNQELRESGHFLEAEALEPPHTAAILRLRGGKSTVTDGPYAETKEMIAGFYLVEAKDRDEAIAIAERIPAARHGTIEVRQAHPLQLPDTQASS